MNKLTLLFLVLTINFIAISCSRNEANISNKDINKSPAELYILANQSLSEDNYEKAVTQFGDLIQEFPLSNEGIQSHIMIGFIDYLIMDYQQAIIKFDRIIKLYPSHKNIDYAYYMRAMCFFEQIEHESLDGINSKESFKSFNQIINRFPNSQYAKDSKQKLIFINENIAAKNMNIALFYLKQKKYLASINRYNKIINNHKKSKFVPEALFRLVEIYYTLGLIKDAEKTASVLAYNYPKTLWYENAYNLLTSKEDNKLNIIKKISNFIKKDG